MTSPTISDSPAKEYNLRLRDIGIIIFAILVLAIFYFAPQVEGLSQSGKIMIGILVLGAILWITEPIPLPVTGLLILIVQPILGIMPAKDVFSAFGNQAVFFLIGAFILAAAVEKHGLHRRIALRLLSFFEHSPRFFTLGIMLSCALLSFVMPEHGVAALFLPIVVSVLIAMKIPPRESNFGIICMLAIAYGCSIGSLGTLVGGARNPLTIAILSDLETPILVSFFDWMIYSMPVVLLSLPAVWIILQFSFPIELHTIESAKREIENQVIHSGRMKMQEKLVSIILIFTIILWVFFSSPHYFGYAIIALLGSILLFISGTITWKDVEKRVPWGVILLYGGAITLGVGMETTGAGTWIAHNILAIVGTNPYLVILGLIIITMLLTNIMSNVGAVAVLLPIGIALAEEIPGLNPLLAALIVALSGGLAFIFIIATPGNAITYSSGYFSSRNLFKAGVLANCICLIIIFGVAIFYWQGVLGL
ncbi:MAG: DASS family sodium-coupled anion symporter [Candidatus Thermoplasmatota archaeon]|nr:DASS family sodium-coupled anion symporter [Candidatus Thermoplasmatota archaeon]MBU1941329.1 DASS family sodium-coupled anion symporter [Candidatus Thermoplasmatota archaeon]